MIKNYWNKGKKQKTITIIVSLIILIALFALRDDYQPALLFVRKFIFIILLCGLVLFLGLRKFRKSASTGSRLGILGLLVVFFGILYAVGWHFKMYEDDYDIELWNPVLTFYQKSPDVRYISDSNFVGKIDLMAVSDID